MSNEYFMLGNGAEIHIEGIRSIIFNVQVYKCLELPEPMIIKWIVQNILYTRIFEHSFY